MSSSSTAIPTTPTAGGAGGGGGGGAFSGGASASALATPATPTHAHSHSAHHHAAHQQSSASTIEGELWRIFSFYSLHSDPTLPEQLKVPSFIRFCKDAQIISNKLKGAQIELEIARVARSRRAQTGVDYNPSYSLSFLEFLNLLELLSQKVWL
jgi:hypothetical protein